MYLLIMNEDAPQLDIPEFTIYDSFAEALDVAFNSMMDCREFEIDKNDSYINANTQTAYFAGWCEIMPITISSPDYITWMGKERIVKQ